MSPTTGLVCFSDLVEDASRDLDDLRRGANGRKSGGGEGKKVQQIEVFALKDQPYGKISHSEGVCFGTYASLIAAKRGPGGAKSKATSRMHQIAKWAGGEKVRGAQIPTFPSPEKKAKQKKAKGVMVG